jgi:hypothetical protein
MITQARLKELLFYDPRSGLFTWRVSRGRVTVGDVAGCLVSLGYVVLRLDQVNYYAHRLAHLYTKGVWPCKGMDVDHKNGVREDNRWRNLRVVTRQGNLQNQRKAQPRGTSGYLGVSLHLPTGKYRAYISVNGKQKHLGLFKTAKEAYQAYVKAKRRLHAGCTI